MKEMLAAALIVVAGIFMFSAPSVMAQDFCKGDFTYDGDVDGEDMTTFLEQFGRGQYDRPCPPDGPAPVEKTGQTTSHATGDDGDLEKGVQLVTPRFTDNGDGTVTDNQTGLLWLQNANCFGMRTWNHALSDCNGLSAGYCGITDGSNVGDWRLPNYKELVSLIDLEDWIPVLSTSHPFDNVEYDYYWSSTAHPLSSSPYRYCVEMALGQVTLLNDPLWNVWCVKGGH